MLQGNDACQSAAPPQQLKYSDTVRGFCSGIGMLKDVCCKPASLDHQCHVWGLISQKHCLCMEWPALCVRPSHQRGADLGPQADAHRFQ